MADGTPAVLFDNVRKQDAEVTNRTGASARLTSGTRGARIAPRMVAGSRGARVRPSVVAGRRARK